MNEERGWLIERRDPVTRYLTVVDEIFGWTEDSLDAIRFARRSDANKMAEIFETDDVYITEHEWCDPSGGTR